MGKRSSFKYFIGYSDNDEIITSLFIKLPKMIGHAKYFDGNKTMSFKVNDRKLLKKYTKIYERVSCLMNVKLDSEPVYGDNDKYIKTKIKLCEDKVNITFQGNKIPKENASYKNHNATCH